MSSVADKGVDKLNLAPKKTYQFFEKENIMGGPHKFIEPRSRKDVENILIFR